EERERQFLEDLPRMHEADLDRRAIRVVARLRGQPPPPVGEAWDDGLAATFSEAGEIRELLRVYADAFIAGVPAPAEVGGILARLALRWRLGVVSNWPLGVIVERYLEAAGWRACFDAVVVSQTVGWIKPDRRIFEAAAARLGIARPASVLHVGDDLGADVAGARAVGWRTAWLRSRPLDSPLPTAEAAADVRPDLTLDRLEELPELLGA
ncbi:MAG TPA: HAD family hydrolase, partial [Candidatus Limnocylindrales bacterium]